jgi:hypothetical protein
VLHEFNTYTVQKKIGGCAEFLVAGSSFDEGNSRVQAVFITTGYIQNMKRGKKMNSLCPLL